MLTRSRILTSLLTGLMLLVVLSGSSFAQESKSAVAAKELTQALDAAKLSTIAAKDSADPDGFVAAMYFPGVQLLVVAAKYSPAVLLIEKLTKKDYQEVYIDLNSASVAGSKLLIEDMGADGIKADHSDGKGFDSMEQAGKRTVFDDDWRKEQKLKDDQYAKIVADADEQYAKLLRELLAQLKK
jgi:hypothetical protein